MLITLVTGIGIFLASCQSGDSRFPGYDVAENGLFTNTSSLDPGRVHHSAVGFHFFNPVYAVKVLEVSKKIDQLLPDCGCIK